MSAGTSSAGNVRHPNVASVSIGEAPEKVRYVVLEVLRAVPLAVRELVVNRQIAPAMTGASPRESRCWPT